MKTAEEIASSPDMISLIAAIVATQVDAYAEGRQAERERTLGNSAAIDDRKGREDHESLACGCVHACRYALLAVDEYPLLKAAIKRLRESENENYRDRAHKAEDENKRLQKAAAVLCKGSVEIDGEPWACQAIVEREIQRLRDEREIFVKDLVDSGICSKLHSEDRPRGCPWCDAKRLREALRDLIDDLVTHDLAGKYEAAVDKAYAVLHPNPNTCEESSLVAWGEHLLAKDK